MKRRFVSAVLTLFLVLSLFPVSAYAYDRPLYLNFADSIGVGILEDEASFPEYERSRDGWSARLSRYLDADYINYARRGMQTTDILYMLDPSFQRQVDSGVLTPGSWHTSEYPPYDGTPLDVIRENVTKADYISLCVGACDIFSYPSAVKDQTAEKNPDMDELKAELKGFLDEKKLDFKTFTAMNKLLSAYSQEAYLTVRLALDCLAGFAEYARYYPMIVASLRQYAPEAVIILVGNYLPKDVVSFLEETDTSGAVIFFLNRLLDNINIVAKESAAKYHCLYVDTMGIQSRSHPTVEGQSQIYDRIVSVLNGNGIYAGNVPLVHAVVTKVKAEIKKSLTVKTVIRNTVMKIVSSIFCRR